jgi:DNA-binding MarR family transcriptional regulator
MQEPTPAPNTPYWYPDRDHVHDVLDGIRRFRRANAAMRKRMADGMGMNKTDMQALQAVIAAQRHGAPLHPRELADELDISTASTTKLLDRLERSGHLTRVPHPADRRSVTIQATDHAHTEVKDRLASMHRDMEEIICEFTPGEQRAIAMFLHSMADLFDRSGDIEPLRDALTDQLTNQDAVRG